MNPQAKSFPHTYKTIGLVTAFWRPGEDYVEQIIRVLRDKVEDGDIITVSEKAIATASGNMVDESAVKTSLLAMTLAAYWMRLVWGHILGPLCHLRKKTINRFRTYPIEEGGRHKQVTLRLSGFFQALMHGSEGGIDGSNLPFSYVSLPLKTPSQVANLIRNQIESRLHKEVSVMIIDTDKTYSLRNFHFTPRPNSVPKIHSNWGIFAYVLGRFLRLKQRSTPIAISGSEMSAEDTLHIAEIANRARGYGAGRNVWDMVEHFGVSFTEVTWEMLESIEHKPVVIVQCL